MNNLGPDSAFSNAEFADRPLSVGLGPTESGSELAAQLLRGRIPVAEPDLTQLEEDYIIDAVRSGWISSLGKYVTSFESEFAAFCTMRYGVATSNGTTALHLALLAAGIGPGDEVILPSLTFVATAAAVCQAGAEPVFIDCDPTIGVMDPGLLEAAISPRTKAILVVHLYGHPADMGQICSFAERHRLLVIEDAAEAHGARYRNQIVGSFGYAACFSFYGNKVITTGEGGMIVTNDDRFNAKARLLRDHAMDPTKRYWHTAVGYNYRITNPQAAIGVAQLQRFAEICAKRQRVLDRYREHLAQYASWITINPSRSWAAPIPWLVCGVLTTDATANQRDRLLTTLGAAGIETRPYFAPIHRMPPYQQFRRVGRDGRNHLTETDSLAARGFNLPSSGNLGDELVDVIAEKVGKALKEVGLA